MTKQVISLSEGIISINVPADEANDEKHIEEWMMKKPTPIDLFIDVQCRPPTERSPRIRQLIDTLCRSIYHEGISAHQIGECLEYLSGRWGRIDKGDESIEPDTSG